MKKINLLLFFLILYITSIFSSQLMAQVNCPAPSGLNVSTVSQNSITLTWLTSNISTIYNVQYQSPGTVNMITISNVTSPLTIPGLNCNSVYVLQLQQACTIAGGVAPILSPWTSITFTTQTCPTTVCEPPLNIAATNITQTGAVLTAVSNSLNSLYNIQYHGPNTATWTTVNNVTLPFQLGNLACGLVYEWKAQRVCTNATGTTPLLSSWTPTRVFTTQTCPTTVCEAPSGLTTTNITQTTAVLNWGIVNNAISYLVYYKRNNNTSVFTTASSNTNSILINGLAANTSYVFQVRAICANGTIATTMSPISLPSIFSTINSFVIFPNPANYSFRVNYQSNESTPIKIELRNNYGQLITTLNKVTIIGSNEFIINTVGVSEGLYFLTINTISESSVSKVYVKH